MILKLAIADKDEYYLSRISKVLENYKDIDLYTYSDIDKFKDMLIAKRMDVILFAEDMFCDEILNKSRLQILMVDESEIMSEQFKEFIIVSKYQRISNIYKRIIENYASVSGMTGAIEGRAIRMAVWSPVGGSGKTTVSMALANALATAGKKVFYLNLETYPSDEGYFESKLEHGMTELAASLSRGENVNYEMKIRGLRQEKKENLYYLKHFDNINDFQATSDDELNDIIKRVCDYGNCEYVILDLDASVSDRNQKLLDESDYNLIIEKDGNLESRKVEAYLESIKYDDEKMNKCIRVKNMIDVQKHEVQANSDCIANFDSKSGVLESIVSQLAAGNEMRKLINAIG